MNIDFLRNNTSFEAYVVLQDAWTLFFNSIYAFSKKLWKQVNFARLDLSAKGLHKKRRTTRYWTRDLDNKYASFVKSVSWLMCMIVKTCTDVTWKVLYFGNCAVTKASYTQLYLEIHFTQSIVLHFVIWTSNLSYLYILWKVKHIH